jgi:hypothetical protein
MTTVNGYDSVSTVAVYKKGKGTIKVQRVHMKNGKGFKELVHKQNGRVTRRSKKALTKAEAKCVRRCQFVPTLFKSCNEECVKQKD